MADLTPTRKSARGRVPNRKYSIDAFEGLDLLSSDSEADAQQLLPRLDDTDEDQDFMTDEAAEDPNAVKGSDDFAENTSDGSEAVTPVEEYEDALTYTSDVEATETDGEEIPLKNTVSRGLGDKRRHEPHAHSRGVFDPHSGQSKKANIKYLFGSNPNDLVDALRSRDKWASDSTFPTRQADRHGCGGIDYPFAHSREDRQAEASVQWDWYYRYKGKTFMMEKQSMETVDDNGVAKYFPSYSKPSHSFLMGPYGKQQVFTLALNQSMFLDQAWSHTSKEVPKIIENNVSQRRSGWILNLGAKVCCLDWAPNHDGITQHLALTVTNLPKLSNPPTSAFAPSNQSLACVQIWAFTASKVSDYDDFFDSDQPPKLVHVVCTEWGSIKQLRWCPVTRDPSEEDSQHNPSIGLLAGIWSDGCVRVLDVQVDKSHNSSDVYGKVVNLVKYESAAFESRPPNTICTCLSWLSSTKIAAGCANGFVAIWDITDQITNPIRLSTANSKEANQNLSILPQSQSHYPYLYQSFHHSYILTIASAYPEYPHILATSSMDGHLRLTDCRNPTADFALAPRARHGTTILEYHQILRAFVAPDDNDFIRILPIRRFFSAVLVGRSPGSPLTISVGKLHSSILVGSADGSVIATNPFRRLLNHKSPGYQQKWFQHEWTRKGEGMSRFTEGYKVEMANLTRTPKGTVDVEEGMMMHITIHEQEAGVSQVAWNPNLRYGGWAAAGMGSGLLRVENLAV